MTPIYPFPPDSGGTKRTLRLLEAADRAGLEVRLFTPDNPPRQATRALVERGWQVHAIGDDMSGLRARAEVHVRLQAGRRSRRLAAAVRASVSPATAFVQAEHGLAASYLEGLPDVRTILSTHNVDSQVERERVGQVGRLTYAKAQGTYRAARMARAERRGSRAHAVLCVSEADASYFRRFAGEVIVAPNGVDEAFFGGGPAPSPEPYILFFGLMTYGPNREGIRRFVREGWPSLAAQCPGLRLLIAGKGSEEALSELAGDPRIAVLGFVEDLAGLAAGAAVIIVPVWQGGGTRLKVLEALATGRPLVGTSLGVSGIGFRDGVHGVVRDDPVELANAVAALSGDAGQATRLGSAGRDLARGYRWPLALAGVEDLYRRYAAMTQSRVGSGPDRTTNGLKDIDDLTAAEDQHDREVGDLPTGE
ncbi:MAG: glycosyltransferase family 4 protein [Solirubrobacteraceae bacterium]